MPCRFAAGRSAVKPSSTGRALSRLAVLILTATAPLLSAGAASQGLCAGKSSPPNVVFILTDDQRWDCLNCVGHSALKTPNMDRVAREGTRFANMFCTTSLCSPSRASMLSGLYPHAHGVVNNFTDYPANFRSFPQQLQAAGYQTAYIGKWHMDENNDSPRPGFNYWASHQGQGKYYDTPFNINGRRDVLKGYYTTRVTDLAVDWIKGQQQNHPFMLMLGHKAPHTPAVPEPKYAHLFDSLDVPYPPSAFTLDDKPEWIRQRLATWHGIYGPLWGFRDKFPDARPEAVKDFAAFVRSYFAVIKSVDDSLGRIFAVLEETGRLDNTLLIFASDNGFFLGEHGMMDKRTAHEESLRIPLLVRYPPLARPGAVVDRMVLNIDIAPSILDICGAPPLSIEPCIANERPASGASRDSQAIRPANRHIVHAVSNKIHGRSWKPLLAGDAREWRTSWFYEYNYEKQFPYTPNVRSLRTDEWKYIHYPHGDGGPDRHKAELYNLKADPQELKNLIDNPAFAAKAAELKAELARLMQETGALPDRMPLDEGVKDVLPDQKIR
jgi:N-acetylglucosamine-6-sulfatase